MALPEGATERALPGLTWRAMTAADLDAVADIALIAFPDHFEGRDCFENRLALNPSGCFVLASEDEAPRGYLVAYPWRARSAPKLNVLIEAIPPDAQVLYLHDLALHPDVRGGGWSRPIVQRLASDARAAGWPALALVAVNDAAPFWARHGFVPVEDGKGLDWLSGYGPDARYMIRPA